VSALQDSLSIPGRGVEGVDVCIYVTSRPAIIRTLRHIVGSDVKLLEARGACELCEERKVELELK